MCIREELIEYCTAKLREKRTFEELQSEFERDYCMVFDLDKEDCCFDVYIDAKYKQESIHNQFKIWQKYKEEYLINRISQYKNEIRLVTNDSERRFSNE